MVWFGQHCFGEGRGLAFALLWKKKQINVRSRDYDTGRFMIIARYRVHA